jgi:hypothetical protein
MELRPARRVLVDVGRQEEQRDVVERRGCARLLVLRPKCVGVLSFAGHVVEWDLQYAGGVLQVCGVFVLGECDHGQVVPADALTSVGVTEDQTVDVGVVQLAVVFSVLPTTLATARVEENVPQCEMPQRKRGMYT